MQEPQQGYREGRGGRSRVEVYVTAAVQINPCVSTDI